MTASWRWPKSRHFNLQETLVEAILDLCLAQPRRDRGARLDREARRLQGLPRRLRGGAPPRRRLSRRSAWPTRPTGALRRATLVLLLAALIWGSMIPVLAALAEHYDKWLLSWSRYVLGLPVLWLAVLCSTPPVAAPRPLQRRPAAAPRRGDDGLLGALHVRRRERPSRDGGDRADVRADLGHHPVAPDAAVDHAAAGLLRHPGAGGRRRRRRRAGHARPCRRAASAWRAARSCW